MFLLFHETNGVVTIAYQENDSGFGIWNSLATLTQYNVFRLLTELMCRLTGIPVWM